MALADHLRELRARLLRMRPRADSRAHRRAVLLRPALRPGHRPPYNDGGSSSARQGRHRGPHHQRGGRTAAAAAEDVRVAAIIVTSPYWLLQIWGFIVPGLHPNEKRWTRLFAGMAGPLFLARRGRRLLRPAQGPRGADRLHAGQLGTSSTSATTSASSPGCCWSSGWPSRSRCSCCCSTSPASSPARRWAVPALDRGRHLRVRRGRDPVHRPVLDADARGADDAAVHDLRDYCVYC